MILSQTTSCASRLGDLAAIELIADAGFDAVDFAMESLAKESNPLNSEDYKDYISKLLEAAKRKNIFFNQAHAVGFIPAGTIDESIRLLIYRNARAIEAAKLLGIKTVVIHPVGTGDYIGNEEFYFQKNMEYFNELLKFAEDAQVTLACENMWCRDKRRGVTRGSVCSNPYEHARYIDEINNPLFVACLDVGHCSLSGREAQDCIRVLGKRLGALHIHDNDYHDDMHTLPGLSEMNFDEITRALADIGYQGDFTLETKHFFDSLTTPEEVKAGLRLSALIGRKMINKIEENRK